MHKARPGLCTQQKTPNGALGHRVRFAFMQKNIRYLYSSKINISKESVSSGTVTIITRLGRKMVFEIQIQISGLKGGKPGRQLSASAL